MFYVDTATQRRQHLRRPGGRPRVRLAPRLRGVGPPPKTFFGKFVADDIAACASEHARRGCANAGRSPPPFQFGGDGREPLGDRYGFRYLADAANGLQSWILVWRSDVYSAPVDDDSTRSTSATWADPDSRTATPAPTGSGLYDDRTRSSVLAYDNDENLFGGVGVPRGPSGSQPGTQTPNYVFLESQRIDLLGAVAETGWNPARSRAAGSTSTLRGPGFIGDDEPDGVYNQGWVGVQHTAPGAFLSVGHAAANLNNQFQCHPNQDRPWNRGRFTMPFGLASKTGSSDLFPGFPGRAASAARLSSFLKDAP